jgi:hypothetical protein
VRSTPLPLTMISAPSWATSWMLALWIAAVELDAAVEAALVDEGAQGPDLRAAPRG